MDHLAKFSLDARVGSADGSEILRDVRKEITSVRSQLSKTKDHGAKHKLYGNLKDLVKELRYYYVVIETQPL